MNWRMVAVIFAIVVAATALNLGAQHRSEDRVEAAQVQTARLLYLNQLRSCYSGNPVRFGTVLAISSAAAHSKKLGVSPAGYELALRKIRGAPFVRPDGTRECREAVRVP